MRQALLIFMLTAVVAVTPAISADAPPAAAAETVAQIIRRTNYVAYYQGADGRAKINMTIVDAQGRSRNREFIVLRRDQAVDGVDQAVDRAADHDHQQHQQFYVYFRRPADVNRMAYLVWKDPRLDKDDDRWLYLPSLDLVRRVAASDMRTSFVGSHFFYEDVSGRSLEADNHELIETNANFYVLQNTPKNPQSVEFAFYRMWIHRQSYIPVQISYYADGEQEIRRYNVLEVAEIDGYQTVIRAQMTDLRTNGYTINEYSDVAYNLGLPEEIFQERYLRRPPLQYLQLP